MKTLRVFAAVTAVFVSGCTSFESQSPAPAATLCPLDGDSRLETAIHDYLLAHGDVVLQGLQENGKKQQAAAAERQRQAVIDSRPALIADPTDPVLGNPAATITIVEFFDSTCPYCQQELPALRRLVAENADVRVVLKEIPLFGPDSERAAKAGFAAMKQDKFAAFHAALMATNMPGHQLPESRLMEVAKGAGLDLARLKTAMADPAIEAKIAANRGLAQRLGITGTPGLIVGDRLVPGAMPYPALVQAVAEARAADKTQRGANDR
jgi:protein-disulfide isomerase